MSIVPRAVEEYGKKNIVKVNSTQTLGEVLRIAAACNYPPNDTWVIVTNYQVIPLSELNGEPAQSLSELEVPPASRVVPLDTPESTGEILAWVDKTQGATMVIIDDDGVVGLFANSRRTARGRDPRTGQLMPLPSKVCANPDCKLPVEKFGPPKNKKYTCPNPDCGWQYSEPQ